MDISSNPGPGSRHEQDSDNFRDSASRLAAITSRLNYSKTDLASLRKCATTYLTPQVILNLEHHGLLCTREVGGKQVSSVGTGQCIPVIINRSSHRRYTNNRLFAYDRNNKQRCRTSSQLNNLIYVPRAPFIPDLCTREVGGKQVSSVGTGQSIPVIINRSSHRRYTNNRLFA